MSTSVRSITTKQLKALHEYNAQFTVKNIAAQKNCVIGENSSWAGGRKRRMLQAIYTLAFLCLLRFDEVLKIQMHQLKVIDRSQGHFKLTLPFRKTHQYGGKLT